MIDFITTQRTSGFVRVELSGEIDRPSAEYLFAWIADLLATGIQLVVIDCAGLGQISVRQRRQLTKCRDQILFAKRVVLLANVNSVPESSISIVKSDRRTGIQFFPSSQDENSFEHSSQLHVRNRIGHFYSSGSDIIEGDGVWRRSRN